MMSPRAFMPTVVWLTIRSSPTAPPPCGGSSHCRPRTAKWHPGTCSGGRHALLAASRTPGFDAIVDMWGGGVVAAPDQLTPKRPVAPIDYTKDLNTPLLGLFGNDDQSPSAEQVNQHERALQDNGKSYEFSRYDGAGHGFFYYHTPLYRQEAAMDGWSKIFSFFQQNLNA
jgi:carboxymethylenebutenolidase